jgi:hypothetical protein
MASKWRGGFSLQVQKIVLCECDEDGFSANSSNSSSHNHSNIASESVGLSLVDIVIN